MNAQNAQQKSPGLSDSRRDFLKVTGAALAGTLVSSALSSRAYAAEDNTIRLALVGCGGRGSGAVGNAFAAPEGGPIKLYAMADIFEDKLNRSHKALSDAFKEKIDVPDERKFMGFDAYKQAIDCLRPGDIALLTTQSYCRPTHLDYAVEKGVHVFMEKSFAPDPAGLHRMLRAGERAKKKNLKISTGLMCRHSVARQAFIEKVRSGEMGNIELIRAYRMGQAAHLTRANTSEKETEFQLRRKIFFPWVCSGRFIEYLIHQVDECVWLKDSYPIAAHGMGGRVPHSPDMGQNLDTYSIEYIYADGTRAMVYSRDVNKAKSDFATYVQGSKKAGQFSGNVHKATVHTYKSQIEDKDNIDWVAEKEPCSPWDAEWRVLLDAIRNDKPHNEVERSIKSNFVAIMGRAACHYNNLVTWDETFASNFQFCPNVDDITFDAPAPVVPDQNGFYPSPIPGQWVEL